MSENYDAPVKIAEGNFWVGFTKAESALRTNVYLIESGDEITIIDPGSVLYFDAFYKQISAQFDVKKIKHFICNHQDPDVCANLPLWEQKVSGAKIYGHTKSNILIAHYGVKSELVNVDLTGMELKLPDRILKFIFMPYMHSPGEIMVYDTKTKVLFSGDIFGGLSMDWDLYANQDYLGAMDSFMENYMPSHEIVSTNLKKLDGLDIEMIAPQHGSIIPKEKVASFIKELSDLECGSFLYE